MKRTIFLFTVVALSAMALLLSCHKEETVIPQNEHENNTLIINANGVQFVMVKVKGGTFMMGASDNDADATDFEKPRHSVTLSDFYMAETEVTQELWQAVMGNNPSNHIGTYLPVESVNCYDCDTFITRLNALTGRTFALPTEAQWEYAARGGNKSGGYKYAGSNNIDDVAWYGVEMQIYTRTVKTKLPNELGFYDMSGNVWEWCREGFYSYTSEPQTDPHGPADDTGRQLRGGAVTRNAADCRVSYRHRYYADSRYDDCGLRLVLEQ